MIAVLLSTRQSSYPALQIVVVIVFLLAIRASAMDLTYLETVLGQAVRDALMLARITEEQAADLMQMDLSALRKCLRGEGRLQLGIARLMRLPFSFWLHFSPTLMYLVAKKNITEIADDLGIKRNV